VGKVQVMVANARGLWLYATALATSIGILIWIRLEREWASTLLSGSNLKTPARPGRIYDRPLLTGDTHRVETNCGSGCRRSSKGVFAVDRIHYSNASLSRFRDQYVATQTPVVITGLTDNWPAMNWSIETLAEVIVSHLLTP